MRVWWDGDLVIKEAGSDQERLRLGHEAEVLRAVAHPGVVRLVRAEGEGSGGAERLHLQRVAGTRLADHGPQPLAVVAGWGAAVATVLADLHDLGYVHGGIGAEHVLIDEQGRPVLCGFGSACRVTAGDGSLRQIDVAALARLISERVPAGEVSLRRALSRYDRVRGRNRGGARELAATLVRHVPDARVGPADIPTEVGVPVATGARSGSRRRAVLLGVAAAAAVAAGATVALALNRPAGPPSRPPSRSPVPAYVMEASPGEAPLTVVGRWGCGPPTPAVLDVRSGAVWLFAGWPAAGAAVRGRLLQRVPGADGLAVVYQGSGCDHLVVLREREANLTLDTEPGR